MIDPSATAIVLGFPGGCEPAKRLADEAGLDYADVDVHTFPDGESLVRLPERLPPRAIFYCSLDHPNEKLIELELAAAAAPGLGAEWLTLVAPYLCYMRQDTAFQPGQAVSQRIIGDLLARRFDTVITVDPHLHRTHDLRDAVPARRAIALSAACLMADELASRDDHPLLVGPDEESRQWVEAIAADAGLDFAIARKQRHGDRDVRIELPDVDIADRPVVIVDDVASSGNTLVEAARGLADGGAASISVLVTHALFVGDAEERLAAAGVTDIGSTDSVPHSTNRMALAEMLASAIDDAPDA